MEYAFSSALIGLREGLEAALVVSILVAYLVKTERRSALRWVWAGVVTAVALSVAFGAVVSYTSSTMSFEQQELFGGTMSLVAVAFVTGMVFWMRSTARRISGELRGRLDRAARVGPVAITLVAFLSVGREGLETAVFFYAATDSAGENSGPLVGFLVGLVVAVALGWAIYRGALKVNLTRFFTVTGVLLVFVAAGVLGYGLHDLQEAAFLPGLDTLAFDLSGPVPEDSWYGALLKGIFNYSARTTVLQAVAWVAYVATTLTLFLRPAKKQAQPPVPQGAQP
ncbi:Ferrous iron transport permease EfeU [Actinokineospora spheciospongiae]|uniref:Ferrous iron transport permease EfeU n=1 Tax=Actinokineospora spheciospongiae TaxID=909613 RepID=W7IPX1_9PSEU|nr:iron uptake transporter permease EfeU [Actinokineospora spheciospongiae]EWC58561.1 Ferrous iron transport permease EfeU [Actinokineospora spheciospongiae]